MRKQHILFFGGAFLAGALGSLLFSPAPVGAVAREIIELQRDVTALLQGQKDITSSLDQKHATIKTLLDQNTAAIGGLNNVMGNLQKAVQDVQANSGTRLDSMNTQVQALSDNLEEVKVRLAKLNQQLADVQNSLQTIDSKLAAPQSGGASTTSAPTGSGTSPATTSQAPTADTLYSNALRDITGGKYDLAKQEFQDYLKYYPDTDLASNAQFYLGEISFAQKLYGQAASEYEKVFVNYPKSFKLAPAHLKRGLALIEINQKVSGVRELREVIRRYPGTDEEKRARAKLKELGVSAAAP